MPTVEYQFKIQKKYVVTEDDLDKCDETFEKYNPDAQEITICVIEA